MFTPANFPSLPSAPTASFSFSSNCLVARAPRTELQRQLVIVELQHFAAHVACTCAAAFEGAAKGRQAAGGSSCGIGTATAWCRVRKVGVGANMNIARGVREGVFVKINLNSRFIAAAPALRCLRCDVVLVLTAAVADIFAHGGEWFPMNEHGNPCEALFLAAKNISRGASES